MIEYTVRVYESRTEWWVGDELHREGGPAIEYPDGSESWYQHNGYHRLDGPAIIGLNGNRQWYKEGQPHRLDGPAFEYADGYKEWWVDGVHLTEEEFKEKTQPGTCAGKTVVIDGKKYRLEPA